MRSLDDLISKHSTDLHPIQLDLNDATAGPKAVESALAALGRLDVLVVNAGYCLIGAVEEVEIDELRAQFEVNVFGAWSVISAALPHMRERGAGHVLVTSSSAGLVGVPGAGAYSASKFAVEGMTEALAGELSVHRIAVTLIEPGPFRTDFARRSMTVARRTIPAYDTSAGATLRTLRKQAGQEPGDPHRAAWAIIDAIGMDDPPLHLVLGVDAHQQITTKMTRLTEDLWVHACLDTQFSDGQAGQ